MTIFEKRKDLRKGDAKMCPKVTICVPCYNEENTIVKTLKSLIKLDYDKDKLEIIVVDDGSTDKTYKKAKAFAEKHKEVNIQIYKKENGGKYTALNLAIEKSTGEFFGGLDADSFVDKKALRKIVKFFEDKNVTAVTPSMLVDNPKGALQRIQYIEYLLGVFLRKVFAEIGSVHVTPGPFSIYRKSFFDEYGGFIQAHHTEDQEMAMRAQRHDKVIENAVDAYVYTVAPNDFRTLYKQRLRWYRGFIRNVIDYRDLFSAKHGNLGMFILPSSFISVIFVIFFMVYFIVENVNNLVDQYLALNAINFDIWELLKHIKIDIFFMNTSAIAVLGIISLMFALIVILVAKKMAKEKKPITISYILFIVFYWMLFGFWWFVSAIAALFTKKSKWGHKSHEI
ncbi:MAG: glycosyltransferase family 2 protein [Nanoarchaeota archaeon]|nr:glycosyltransferase family 2 protein [Nanoarchaeota archaeon]